MVMTQMVEMIQTMGTMKMAMTVTPGTHVCNRWNPVCVFYCL